MSEHICILQGPEAFEHLLEARGLSQREAQAVRSVVLSMTAAEAASLIGVSPSTVGSYRQRAYAKLGVSSHSEFLALPEVHAWTEQLEEQKTEAALPPHAEAREANPESHPFAEDAESTFGSRASGRLGHWALVCAALVCAALVCLVVVGIFVFFTLARPSYLESPQGIVSSEYGDIPNVVGMRADAAASEIANAGFCPEFESCASNLAPGTVLQIERVGSADELTGGVSSFSWGSGCTAGYEMHNQWDGYVVLSVAV